MRQGASTGALLALLLFTLALPEPDILSVSLARTWYPWLRRPPGLEPALLLLAGAAWLHYLLWTARRAAALWTVQLLLLTALTLWGRPPVELLDQLLPLAAGVTFLTAVVALWTRRPPVPAGWMAALTTLQCMALQAVPAGSPALFLMDKLRLAAWETRLPWLLLMTVATGGILGLACSTLCLASRGSRRAWIGLGIVALGLLSLSRETSQDPLPPGLGGLAPAHVQIWIDRTPSSWCRQVPARHVPLTPDQAPALLAWWQRQPERRRAALTLVQELADCEWDDAVELRLARACQGQTPTIDAWAHQVLRGSGFLLRGGPWWVRPGVRVLIELDGAPLAGAAARVVFRYDRARVYRSDQDGLLDLKDCDDLGLIGIRLEQSSPVRLSEPQEQGVLSLTSARESQR